MVLLVLVFYGVYRDRKWKKRLEDMECELKEMRNPQTEKLLRVSINDEQIEEEK